MFAEDMKKLVKENTNFRKVLHTGVHSQLVAMSIPTDGDIGEEIHPSTDQILFFVDGEGEAILNDETRNIEEHDIVFVPAGTKHNFKNTGEEDLKLLTVYAPPHHPDGTIHATKKEAQQKEREGGRR